MNTENLYMNFLRNEGLMPKMENGHIAFKFEGKYFLLLLDKRDNQFLRLMMPNFWEIESEEERLRAYKAANEVSAEMKVGKVIVTKENVHSTAEIFIDSTPDLEDFFMRLLHITKETADRFANRMYGQDMSTDSILRRLFGN